MRISLFRVTVVGVTAVVLCGGVLPGVAAADGTVVTFGITAGGLTVSVPATVDLGNDGVPGGTVTGQLGVVTVADARASLTAAWTATVSTTTFTTGGATAAETIGKASITYAAGGATATRGVGVFTPGQLTTALAVALATPQTAFTLTAGIGSNSASWNPTLVISVPDAAVSGTYSGTVTHSVA